MNKISSRWTYFHKKAFPTIWFGFLAFFVVSTLLSGAAEADLMFLVIPFLMAIFGYFFMKKLVWDLVDEVYDCGDSLLIRNRRSEERIPLSNIMNVSVSTLMNPPRVTLRLVKPGALGEEIAFSPISQSSLNPFAKSEVAEDLMVRVDRARSKRALLQPVVDRRVRFAAARSLRRGKAGTLERTMRRQTFWL